jgi:hypothetical protein
VTQIIARIDGLVARCEAWVLRNRATRQQAGRHAGKDRAA